MKVPDYYAMLGVDPRADRETIEEALARRQPQWSSGTRNPKTKHSFQSFLDQVPALRQALLSDPQQRAAYDYRLASSRREQRDRLVAELDRLVRLRAAKGGLTVTDRDRLRERAAQMGLEEHELAPMLEAIPPLPDAPRASSAAKIDTLDPATRRQIALTLEHIERRDLYDALGLPRDAAAGEVAARADAERQRWMRKTQVTAEKTAWLEAIAYAQAHLGGVDARARYDRTLAAESEAAFREAIDFALESAATMNAAARAAILDEAARLGLAPDRAAVVLDEECRRRDVKAVGPGEDGDEADGTATPSRWLRCRRCGGVTALERAGQTLGALACRHCQASLKWDCPICKRSSLVDETSCACGFAQAWAEPFARLWEEAEAQYRARNDDAALASLEQLRAIAPRLGAIDRIAAKIDRRRKEAAATREELDRAIASRRLMAARAAVIALAALVPDDDPGYVEARGVVERDLRDAATLIDRARAAMADDPALARTLLLKALALAADSDEARDALRACPPDAPAKLLIGTDPAGVTLSWKAPTSAPQDAIRFRVRRSVGVEASRSSPVVAETAQASYRDADAPSAASLWYAVATVRDGVESVTHAAAGPIVLLREVSELKLESTTRAVSLSWTTPPGAVAVRVDRTTLGAGSSGGGKTETIASAQGRALDQAVEPDRAYRYTVRVSYPAATEGGPPRVSSGVAVEAFTASRASPVLEVDLRRLPDGTMRVGWNARGPSRVTIYRLDRAPSVTPGAAISADALGRAGAVALPLQYDDHAIDPSPERAAATYYLPVTSWNGSTAVGRAAVWLAVPDPSDLRAARSTTENSGQVMLRWRWAPGATSSLVLARSGASPTGPEDPRAVRFEVAESDYAREGRYRLNLPADQPGPWHLAVRSVVEVEGRATVSEGREPTSRLVLAAPSPVVQVSYQIHRPRFPGRSWRVSFRTDPPGQEVPPTTLVAHPRTVPLSADDGEVIDHFPATRDGASFRVRSRASQHLAQFSRGEARARVFADPRTDPATAPVIRIRHPGSEATRV
jgi:hypothetical protein